MHSQAQDIVRTIREGLGMSRAEFARALGWSQTTISRWETGKAQPNRLSLKIILAFGEERGVRWRPRQTLPALVAPVRPLPSVEVRPVHAEVMPEGRPTAAPRRPRWEAEVSFRVAVDRSEPRSRRWLGNATVGAASCAVVLLGLGVFTTGASSSPTPDARLASAAVDVPAPVRPAAAFPAAEDSPRAVEVTAAAPAAEPVVAGAPEPAPVIARLEGVTLLGTVRRATFRTDDDALTVDEGEQLGDRQAVRIAGNAVQLADTSGHVQIVRLGESVALE
jgi:transcriptional regulator with XRE-family HTH domain